MRILLTGASGFVGQNVLTALHQQGHEVLALSRSPASDTTIKSLGGQVIRGNLDDINAWAESLPGIDVVIHAAAPVEIWGEWSLFNKQIVLATYKLADAAAKAGVKRFIYISSESALQDKGELIDIDETFQYPDQPNSPYGRAKKLAELELLVYRETMTVIILRPPFVWGENSPGVAQVLEATATGKFVWIDNGETAFEAIHVTNLVQGIVLALTRGDSGVYWLTDGRDYSVRSFFTPLMQQQGLPAPRTSMPGGLVRTVAQVLESLWTALRIRSKPPITRFEAAFLGQPRRYRIERARRLLGYEPV